ncbi:MAG TPA: ParA family protein [Acidimicrobiales bacterium]|nr:ParA family protein [Acidimicrobiales bacterium]
MIVVVAGLKGGVGKTTTSVYLAALAAGGRRRVTLVDADPQASAAEWAEASEDERLQKLEVVEAPTERLLTRALNRIDNEEEVAVVDTPPGQERFLATALALATVAVVPTRVGGVETSRAEAVFELVPAGTPAGLVISSARTYTNDYHSAVTGWAEAGIAVWGAVPERVAIAAGPGAWLSEDGLDALRPGWQRALRAARAA